MVQGTPAPAAHVEGLDRYLTTVLDHGLNASTFAARVIASTNAGAKAGLLGAMGALSGPLHGGAPGPVLDMLDAVEDSGDPHAWVGGELRAGRRLMGLRPPGLSHPRSPGGCAEGRFARTVPGQRPGETG